MVRAPFRAAIQLILALSGLSIASVGQSNPSQSSTQIERPDAGTTSGNVYANEFFDLTFEFPKGWIPHGDATKRHLMEVGNEKLSTAMPGSETAIRVAEKRVYNLLTVFENELGTPGVRFFRSEILMAEDVSYAPGVKTGKDYLLNVLPLMKKQGYDRFSEITETEIGDRTFYRADLSKQATQDVRAYQAYFATIVRGYAVSLIVSTEDPDETAKLAQNPQLHFGSNPAKAEAASIEIEGAATLDPRQAGSMSSGLYHNKFFDMSYRLPEGWYVDTSVFEKLIKETTASPPSQRSLVTLLAANEVAPGTPGVTFDPFLTIMAYDSSRHPETMSCNGYLQNVTYLVTKRQHGQLIRQGAKVSVRDHEFYRADYKRSDSGYETVLCTIWKSNDLSWTFVGRSPKQMDDLVQSIRSVSFSRESH